MKNKKIGNTNSRLDETIKQLQLESQETARLYYAQENAKYDMRLINRYKAIILTDPSLDEEDKLDYLIDLTLAETEAIEELLSVDSAFLEKRVEDAISFEYALNNLCNGHCLSLKSSNKKK